MWILKNFGSKDSEKAHLKHDHVLEIEKKGIKKWEVKDVLSFIELMRFKKEDYEEIKKYVQDTPLTGHVLLTIEPSSMDPFLQLVPARNREKLYVCIGHVQRNKKLDIGWIIVFCKLFRMTPDHIEIIKGFADVLSDKQLFYEKYFSFYVDYFEMKELEFQMKELIQFDHKKNKKLIRNLKKKIFERKEKLKEKYEKLTEEKYIDLNFVGLCGAKLTTTSKSSSSGSSVSSSAASRRWAIPCKLVVTEIYDESQQTKKKLRDFISPIIQKIPKYKTSTRFGLFHTAITIGPFYLEWRNHEISVPKKSFGSKNAIISHDVPTLYDICQTDIRKLVDGIVDVVFRWNTSCFYAQRRDINKGNCQDFVDEILKELGIDSSFLFSGMLGNFIKGLRKNGKAMLEFAPSLEFRNETKMQEKRISFETHRELDHYISTCMERCVTLAETFPSEFLLLKSFDRAFWLKFLRNPQDKRFIPAAITKDNPSGCPLKDPRSTMSYLPF